MANYDSNNKNNNNEELLGHDEEIREKPRIKIFFPKFSFSVDAHLLNALQYYNYNVLQCITIL